MAAPLAESRRLAGLGVVRAACVHVRPVADRRRSVSLAGLRVRHNSCVATDPSTPLPLRPSVADRERVARILRDRSVEGRLSLDTYSERIERLYGARTHDELDELVCDVQPAAMPRRLLLGLVEWVSRIVADVEAAWEGPRLPVIALPMGRVTVGRAPDCDCVIWEPTVSRHHARTLARRRTLAAA
jgi:hypothetical protein